MSIRLLFNDINFKNYLEKYTPYHFEEARCINTNDKTTNMSVGRDREDIIKLIFKRYIDLHFFINSDIDVPEHLNYDGIFFDKKVQIKTRTVEGNATGDFKLNWASGLDNADLFKENFEINTDILYVRISSKNKEINKIMFSYISENIQKEIFYLKGYEGYFNIKEKDSKGIKINNKSLKKMLYHNDTLNVSIPYVLNNDVAFKNRIEYWNHRINEYEKKITQIQVC